MFIFNALTKFAQFYLIAALLIAYSVNALANLEIRLKDHVFGLSSHQLANLKKELEKDENFPVWLLKTDRSRLLESFEKTARSLEGNKARFNISSLSLTGSLTGQVSRFEAFYLENIQAFKSVCAKALSLEECKPMVWREARELMGRKLALTVHDGVNELLFRKNNPFVDEVKVPVNSVLKSLGFEDKEELPSLDEFLASYKSEFNVGGYAPGLINDHPAFAEAKKLLGPFSAKEVNWLFLESHENPDLILNKFDRAFAVFEMEWESFARNVLVPSAWSERISFLGRQRIVMHSAISSTGFSALSAYVCSLNKEAADLSPEFDRFCHFSFQKAKMSYSLL